MRAVIGHRGYLTTHLREGSNQTAKKIENHVPNAAQPGRNLSTVEAAFVHIHILPSDKSSDILRQAAGQWPGTRGKSQQEVVATWLVRV